jgi:hypothetical protein|tara:strand:+ start:5141 stop:6253 length:1113 start_codon:yes stop_codon:yes gene_type:complete
MATTFKDFQSNDLANTRTLLHEAIPITGSIVSGTYAETNIKTYGHGMFSSVYDYPFLSSSANHIFDTTLGISATSSLYASVTSQKAKKLNIYNQMAQTLVGYDDSGNIKKFVIPETNATMHDVYVIPFSRLLSKDEIKKGSFSLELAVSGTFGHGGPLFNKRIQLSDASGSDGYYVDSPAGEYGVLFATTSAPSGISLIDGEVSSAGTRPSVGLVYYQAGIAIVSSSAFNTTSSGGILKDIDGDDETGVELGSGLGRVGFAAATASTIATMNTGLRNRIYNISFNNTTELNSTIYFCRAGHTDFNYSSNPTYLNGSEIRVKTRPSDTPVAYFTTVGLYSADNELLAVAKLSEPLRKDPTNELTLRVRLDY